MSEFIEILTHGRRLQGAVKDLSINELQTVVAKLESIIDKREKRALELEQAEKEKQAKIAQIRKQMEEAGLDMADLQIESDKPKRKTGQKRPVKYTLTDDDGNQHNWTGIGRMPKVYAAALESGKSLSDFAV